MIINNTVVHAHELAKLVHYSYRINDMPEKTYRIKLNGKFIRVNGRSDWLKTGSAKRAMKAAIRSNSYGIQRLIHGGNVNHGIKPEDIKNIYDELVNANLLEIVEITN